MHVMCVNIVLPLNHAQTKETIAIIFEKPKRMAILKSNRSHDPRKHLVGRKGELLDVKENDRLA